jgi:hypothetical protein
MEDLLKICVPFELLEYFNFLYLGSAEKVRSELGTSKTRQKCAFAHDGGACEVDDLLTEKSVHSLAK